MNSIPEMKNVEAVICSEKLLRKYGLEWMSDTLLYVF